ncbi:MAG: hypothetical protein V4707_09685 [Pseudomonadota bacterium]
MHDLNRALGVYLGVDESSFPKESLGRVVGRFGAFTGLTLGMRAKAIVGELGRIKPDWDRHDLLEASQLAAEKISKRHDLDDEGRDALVWIYSWWWK